MKTNYLFFILAFCILACQPQEEVKSQEERKYLDNNKDRDAYLDILGGDSLIDRNDDIEDDVIHCYATPLIQFIPSPLDIAMLTKENIRNFDTKNLCLITDNYKTNNQKALAIGLYSAAVGYCNLYSLEKQQKEYLYKIGKLGNDLQIIKYLSIDKFGKKMSFENLLNTTQTNYDKLVENEKKIQDSYVNVLIVVGSFIEANYQTLLLYEKLQKEKADTTILNKWKDEIGKQKYSVDGLDLYLNVFKPYNKYKYIGSDFKHLTEIYRDVEIVTKQDKPKMYVEKGEYFITDNKITIVTISDSTVSKFFEKIKEIRSKIVK